MMDEETWLNANEAYELGFIDTISDSIKVAAKYDVSKFKNITQEEIQNKLSININNKKMTNELKEWFNNKVEEIVTAVKGDVKVSEDVAEQTMITVNLGDNDEIMNKISEFETGNIELSNKISLLEEELVASKGTNETLTVEVEALNAKINKADAKGTEIVTEADPAVVENKKEDANAGFYNAMAGRIRNKDRKSTRLNSSHLVISYAVFCLKKQNKYVKSVTRAKVRRQSNTSNQHVVIT